MGNGRKGNGLRNMSKRIEGLGGELSIESALAKGTRIKILVKLQISRRPGIWARSPKRNTRLKETAL